MATLKASNQGLAKIKQVRNEQGWTIDDPRWLIEASQIVEPTIAWSDLEQVADGVSEGTWKRFLSGKSIETVAFKAFCQVLNLNWEEVIDRSAKPEPRAINPSQQKTSVLLDWGDAPDISVFYDRSEVFDTLTQLLVVDRCRLVALLGMGGIGKTALAVKLTEHNQPQFEGVIWRSLRSTPALSDLLTNLITCLTHVSISTTIEALLSTLIQQLRQRRILLILDGWENILGGDRAGQCKPGYEGYGELLRRIGSDRHQSCLLLTSRENPEEVTLLEDCTPLAKSHKLAGLGTAATEILQAKGLVLEPQHWHQLIQIYRGNPLALNVVATLIQELFDGKVSEALKANTMLGIDQVNHVLTERVRSLSSLEQQLLCCLARDRNPMTREALRSRMSAQASYSEFVGGLSSLDRRSLLEKSSENGKILFTLQPMVMRFVTKLFLA
ncbi:NB-ARC domain-containing protein [Phormidesmis priestleyi ULC007]|uniref:NB-ARC domain-containing protein n=2 Tax=Phormidesmis priestleyi TaxID=268141 RepID=A0A2T1D4J6_9CYAN|nr:NB-ARC domain-containing protein [Phormidesmis priestleyi]PSB15398.1 NB-ARC domain-containing protein [Phormidesmis priestleyi ULC007]PZO46084.1 MAG: NACHT domain-containing protein [Phormidesmis priestleyi]